MAQNPPVDRNDPKVKKIVDAWLTYAKREKISTPSQEGRNAEDKDVIAFIHEYLAAAGLTIDPTLLDTIERVISTVPGGADPKLNTGALNRVKALIKNKLSDAQKRQLRRELVHG